MPATTDTGDAAALLTGFKVRTGEGIRNAAVVLFGKPDTDYSQCLLRLARFKGTDKSVFLDNKQVTGNVFRLLDARGWGFVSTIWRCRGGWSGYIGRSGWRCPWRR